MIGFANRSYEKSLLTEGVESKNMKAAKHYLYQVRGYNEQQAMKMIGDVKTSIPNSRLGQCKFILAMVRMFCNGEFDDATVISKVNKSLKYAASDAHINEYDNNLNDMTAEELINKFAVSGQEDLEQDKNDVSSQEYNSSNSKYEIVKINSFDEAEEYAPYVSWCVTQFEDMYDTYTGNGSGVFYFCLRDGWENEPEEKGENCPLDDYGLSMIAVSVNFDGSVNTITCRWNHDNGGNDTIMTTKQLSEIINMNFYSVFKPLTPEEIERNRQYIMDEIKDEISSKLYGGESIADIAQNIDLCYDPYWGDEINCNVYSYESEKRGSYVIIDEYGNPIINQVFDGIGYRMADIITVTVANKSNFLRLYQNRDTIEGRILCDKWFNKAINAFRLGYGKVCLNRKWNLVDKDGQYIFNEWCDAVGSYFSDFIELINNQKSYFYNIKTGKIVFNRPVKKAFNATAYNLFIEFDGDDFFQAYNPTTLTLKAPWKISRLLGYYHDFYKVQLTNGIEYFIDNDGNLLDCDTQQMVYQNNMAQNESVLRHRINQIVRDTINEVRYIDTKDSKYNRRVTKKDWRDIYAQEPINNNDTIRVYHGCSLKTALDWTLHGTSGREWHPRTYSYENGMNPLGIFVTVDFETAKKFGYDNECMCVIEFTAKAHDLESPIWNNSDTYFGQGTNPMPFNNKMERDTQKQKYRQNAKNIEDYRYWDYKEKANKTISYDHIRKSDKPEMAYNVFDNPEHQALFMGDLNPNQIKRIWINPKEDGTDYVNSSKSYIPLTVGKFIKKYGKHEFYIDGRYGNEKSKLQTNKLYKPNDNFNGWDDYIKRDKFLRRKPKYAEQFMSDIERGSDYIKKSVANTMFPKQIIQSFGKDYFDNNFNRLGL